MFRALTNGEIAYVAQEMSYCPSLHTKSVANIASNGEILACILYDHWTISCVQVHVYAKSLAALFNRDFLHEIFTFPFITGGRKYLIGVTPANQKASLAVSGWLGFKEVTRIPDGWDTGVDMIVKRLSRTDCRFLPKAVKLAS